MSADVVIVYTPVGGGHKAAALAVAEVAKGQGHAVEVINLFDWAPPIVCNTYRMAHLRGSALAPNLYGKGYDAANRRDGAFEPLRRGFDHVAFCRFLKLVCALDPDVVVSTHHLPLVVLGRARRHGWLSAPLTCVVTDYTSHACWAEPGVDAFCVPCPVAFDELSAHGVDGARITETGIPVRPAFEAIPDVVAPAPGEPLRVLVTSGGFGVGPMCQIVRSFHGMSGVELTVVCGNAKGVEARVSRAAAEARVKACVIGFERDMAARVREAHIVVGKAGGLTVSETLAAGRPMILVGTVPGNEVSNERFVVGGGAGCTATAIEAGAVASWLRARSMIEAMGRSARALVRRRTAERVLAVAMAAGGGGTREIAA